ncbi:MAG: hypothetical protein WBB31_07925 [Saprospiraceae bacterium]
MDLKITFGILATCLTVTGYVPYFRDIFAHKTKPHLYTWLVWALTQGTAAFAMVRGGGKWGAISLFVGTVLVIVIFFLCFKYGTRNIKRSDTIALVTALIAILIWWQLNNPVLAVLLVSFIDALGYIPTYRKTYTDTSTETVSFWICMIGTDIFALLANSAHNILTMSYLVTLGVCNMVLVGIILFRRRRITMERTIL